MRHLAVGDIHGCFTALSTLAKCVPFTAPSPHESGKIMICGHTPQKTGMPLNLGHAVCIDTWAHGKGWLTCLDVGSGKYWQANERGESRSSWLEEEV